MTRKAYIREATVEDVPGLISDLRQADLCELRAASKYTPEENLLIGISSGYAEVACLPEGTPAAIFGVSHGGVPDLGVIWMVATNRFMEVQVQFLRECRGHIERLGQDYKALYNFTDARNSVHHRWLKWCGFTFLNKRENFGTGGESFYEFVRLMEKRHV